MHRSKIAALVLAAVAAAVMMLALAGGPKSLSLRAANYEIAQDITIDIWQLHMQADIDHMPVLTVADPV